MSCRCRPEGEPLQEARQGRRGMLEGRPCLFGSGSAGGVLFSASRKRTPDLLPSRPRSTPLSLRPPAPVWREPRCPGNPLKRGLRFSVAPLRSARSLRSLAPLPRQSARNLPARRCGGEPAPLSPAPPLPGAKKKKECPLYLARAH